jgi:predicted nucleic acid-binding protein
MLVERWKRTQPSQIRLCSFVKAELLFGAEKSSKRELAQKKRLLLAAQLALRGGLGSSSTPS